MVVASWRTQHATAPHSRQLPYFPTPIQIFTKQTVPSSFFCDNKVRSSLSGRWTALVGRAQSCRGVQVHGLAYPQNLSVVKTTHMSTRRCIKWSDLLQKLLLSWIRKHVTMRHFFFLEIQRQYQSTLHWTQQTDWSSETHSALVPFTREGRTP